MPIYLDHNAGAPIRPAVRAALAAIADCEGNPASVHRSGQRARRALEQARMQVARLIEADPRTIIFTSGGTESNNLAIFGATAAAHGRRKVISSPIEHSSILEPLTILEGRGFEIVKVPVDGYGRVDSRAILEAIDSSTALVTLGLANSEVGTIQELAPLAASIRSAGALLHIDAAQAAGRIPIAVDVLGCDLMTLSGHKLGAPPGSGALFVRSAVRLAPQMAGGPQENGYRAGTPNLPGAVGFGAAAEVALADLADESPRICNLAERLMRGLSESIPGLPRNGPLRDRIANTLNLTFPGVLGESMLIALDLEGIEVSMGSACAAGSVEPSHVLIAMGRDPQVARSSLRISLGWSTTAAEIDRAIEIIPRVWRRVAAAEGIAGVEATP
ncbi:MAG: cysteine desulfurase [Candidatus Binataceae bacterium]|nr:cysteine desulfurase [Candidatus Binataceae bacterium]